MKKPGDTGMQGIEIEQLEVDKQITMREAVELAKELAEDLDEPYEILWEDEYSATVDGEFVRKAIDFRRGDCFLIDKGGGALAKHRVTSDHNWSRKLETVELRMEHDNGVPFDHGPDSFADLWLAWLQGRVVEVKHETTFIRQDTGEKV